MTTPSMPALAERLATDLDAAFPAYVRATADGIYAGALRMLGSPADAEDVMQDTYVRAYRALSDYPARRIRDLQVRAWTWTIAANLCRNRLRSRTRQPTAPLDGNESPTQGADATALPDRLLQAALLELPFPQRSAVVMRHVLDLRYEEIATALERPVGTVKSDVHRALAALRQLYQEARP